MEDLATKSSTKKAAFISQNSLTPFRAINVPLVRGTRQLQPVQINPPIVRIGFSCLRDVLLLPPLVVPFPPSSVIIEGL